VHVTDSILLDEARRHILKAMEGEIERRTGERFEGLQPNYEATMSKRVYERLVEILEGRLWPRQNSGHIP